MPSPSISQPVARDALEANRFGRFTVLEQAGAGSMGVVYAAYDPSLDRRVALKVLRGSANAGRRRDAVRREALALARVSHPNVVPIYEVAEADGRLFLAMEYVDGPTLDTWLKASARPWTRIVELFVDMAGGLAAAHAQGLVHRDFKPANVLVGADERPRIIDFGLARALDEGPDDDAAPETSGEFARLSVALSRNGRLKGTPAYMAPEQIDGKQPTIASDQFNFCVSLFEALSGQAPFPRDSLPILRSAIARGDFTDSAGVPNDVMAIVRRGLAADPSARWPSMDALGIALRAALQERARLDRGSRARLATTALVVVFAAVAFGALFSDFPATPLDFLFINVGACGLLALTALGVSVLLEKTAANRRLTHGLIALLVAKQATALLGYRLGMSLPQLFGADLATTLAVLWPVSWYLHVKVGWAFMLIMPVLAVALVWPESMAYAHSVGMFFLAAGFITADWRKSRTLRHAGQSAPT